MSDVDRDKICRRQIFYISGFDPRGARFYRNLYKRESGKASQLFDASPVEVGKVDDLSVFHKRWRMENADKGVSAEYNFLDWGALIRKFWYNNPLFVIFFGALVYVAYFFSGAILKVVRMHKGVASVMLMPLMFIVISIWLSLLVAELVAPDVYVRILVFSICFYGFVMLAKRLNILWLLRIYFFCTIYEFIDKEECVDGLISSIKQTVDSNNSGKALSNYGDGDKEVESVIVAHSVGVIIAVSVIAKMLRDNPEFLNRDINILSLGGCSQLVSYMFWSKQFREDLDYISSCKNVRWLEVSSLVDGACVPCRSPFSKVGVIGGVRQNDDGDNFIYKKISPRFHKMFSSDKYRKWKLDKFNVHFQYIKSSDLPVEYSYFDIIEGDNSFAYYFNKLQ